MKKGCIIGCVVAAVGGALVAVIVTIAIVAAFSLTSGAVTAADEFLKLLGNGMTSEAYASTAADFQKNTTQEEFDVLVRRLGLNEFASASWSSRSVNNNLATLEGTVTSSAGGSSPLKMQLIHENDQWKVLSLEGTMAGAAIAPVAQELPPDEELQTLVEESLLDFNAAVQAKDFGSFHDKISALWQGQITAEQLQEIFQVFIDSEIDIAPIEQLTPEFSEPPAITPEGTLEVVGFYPTQPSRVSFELTYCYEDPAWKLAGIQVNVK